MHVRLIEDSKLSVGVNESGNGCPSNYYYWQLQNFTQMTLVNLCSGASCYTNKFKKFIWWWCCNTCAVLQVMSLSPAPLSLLIKAAPILTDDMYGDVQPAAWELLLSVDEHMAAAAGKVSGTCTTLGLKLLWLHTITPTFPVATHSPK